MMIRRLMGAFLLCLLLAMGSGAGRVLDARAAAAQPNIVFILTDDQRWNELGHMPNVQNLIAAEGVKFTNSYVSNSLCCPSRTSILTGFYSHTTGVYFNSPPNGGFATFHAGPYEQTHTLPIWLHDAGYRTALIGKYLNGYNNNDDKLIPAGWDDWYAENITTQTGTGGYLDWYASDNGVRVFHGATDADYSTDVLAQQSLDFINSTPPTEPLFLWFAPHAPHDPATPPTRYASACSSLKPFRRANVGVIGPDEPAWVQALTWTARDQKHSDTLMMNRCRTLMAVDDAVGQIVQTLQMTGRLANTLIVFASDNGWSSGSHRWGTKRAPWNESARVPLIMRWDGRITPNTQEPDLAVNIDWTETFADAAGVTLPSDVEGFSLLPELRRGPPARTDFLTESYDSIWTPSSPNMPPFCGVRSRDWLYVKYQTGEQQLYDERADPYELHNLVHDPAYADVLAARHARMVQLCQPPPPGYTP
jgi:arylsulfatase A-like enzyme